jgi:hypothetical protein
MLSNIFNNLYYIHVNLIFIIIFIIASIFFNGNLSKIIQHNNFISIFQLDTFFGVKE